MEILRKKLKYIKYSFFLRTIYSPKVTSLRLKCTKISTLYNLGLFIRRPHLRYGYQSRVCSDTNNKFITYLFFNIAINGMTNVQRKEFILSDCVGFCEAGKLQNKRNIHIQKNKGFLPLNLVVIKYQKEFFKKQGQRVSQRRNTQKSMIIIFAIKNGAGSPSFPRVSSLHHPQCPLPLMVSQHLLQTESVTQDFFRSHISFLDLEITHQRTTPFTIYRWRDVKEARVNNRSQADLP